MAGAPSQSARRALRGLMVGGAAALLAGLAWATGLLDGFENSTFDLRARALARKGPATDQVVTILLDQYSLDEAAKQGLGWPWPRSLYGMVTDFCARGGAKALVFDVLYTEETNEFVSEDEAFAAAMEANGHVVAALNLASSAGQGKQSAWPEGLARPSVAVEGLDRWPVAAPTWPNATFPIEAVARSAAMLANANLPADAADNIYRREPLLGRFGGLAVPSEALAAWAVGVGGKVVVERGRIKAGNLEIPIDADGRAILRYRGPTLTHRATTAWAVLQASQQLAEGKTPNLDPALFKDKYVFFGFTAPGLFDLKPSPMAASYPGVEVHATMLDNLLSGDFMRPTPTWLGVLLLVLVSLGAAVSVSAATRATWSGVAYVVFLPAVPLAGLAAYAAGAWLPVVPLELGALFALMGASLANYATEGRQKRYLKDAFKQYMNHDYIEQLIANPQLLQLGGERKELTIYFSDVQGFTSISERLSPEDLTALLNEYLSAMTDIIQEEGGTIDKYEGDAVIAFWNAPLSLEDHAVRGLRSALRCQAKLDELRPRLKARAGTELRQRIGMNTGHAVVGNMGSSAHFNYTMLGDAVNLAARLEGVNKQFGTYTMVSEALVKASGGAFPCRELSRIAVVGKSEPVRVFEPMLPEAFASRKPTLDRFAEGLALYYEGRFTDAESVFAGIEAVDPPAKAYRARCAALARDPAVLADWKGVWTMTEK